MKNLKLPLLLSLFVSIGLIGKANAQFGEFALYSLNQQALNQFGVSGLGMANGVVNGGAYYHKRFGLGPTIAPQFAIADYKIAVAQSHLPPASIKQTIALLSSPVFTTMVAVIQNARQVLEKQKKGDADTAEDKEVKKAQADTVAVSNSITFSDTGRPIMISYGKAFNGLTGAKTRKPSRIVLKSEANGEKGEAAPIDTDEGRGLVTIGEPGEGFVVVAGDRAYKNDGNGGWTRVGLPIKIVQGKPVSQLELEIKRRSVR